VCWLYGKRKIIQLLFWNSFVCPEIVFRISRLLFQFSLALAFRFLPLFFLTRAFLQTLGETRAASTRHLHPLQRVLLQATTVTGFLRLNWRCPTSVAPAAVARDHDNHPGHRRHNLLVHLGRAVRHFSRFLAALR
jgi:hypothetical protein